MVLLGIDPGFTVTGFGILKKEGARTFVLDHGALKMRSADTLAVRVLQFHDFFETKIKLYGVTAVALETPFLGKNAQNFLKLGYLRGIINLLAARYQLTLHEFSPREVKLAVTGFGGAEKEQVARVIMRLFPLMQQPGKLDITDALAISLCGLWKGDGVNLRVR